MAAPSLIASTTFALVIVWATLTRLRVLSHSSPRATRHWVHFGLGTSYEIAWACLYGLIVYTVSWAHAPAGAWLGAAIAATIAAYYYADYQYFLVFQTHMPYSVGEYAGEMKSLRSSILGILLRWDLAAMVAVPAALAVWLLVSPWAPWRALAGHEQGWQALALPATMLLAGLIANTISNSYVTKNPFNALQFTPIQFLLRTRRLTAPEPAVIDGELLDRLGAESREYPFLRTRSFDARQAPLDAFSELCAGLRGMQRPPNIVFVVLESYRAAEVGALGSRAGVSPVFDSLSRRGILFPHFFANGFQTRDALITSYCSTLPNFGPSQMRFHPHAQLLGLPQLLRERGYATAWYHNADAEFDRMREFLTRHGFQKILDEFDFPLLSERLGWGISDEALVRLAAEELRGLPEPFFASLLTMSNHHPYAVPRAFRRHSSSGEYGRYLDSFAYTDFALGLLMELASRHPYFERTIFFIYADSSNRMPAPVPVNGLRDLLALSHQVPLLIHAPWIKRGTVVQSTLSHVDIPPTALGLIGHAGKLPWIGRSSLSPIEDPLALVHKPGEYMALVTDSGAGMLRAKTWEWEGTSRPDLAQWCEDVLLLNRWAIENNRFVPSGEPAQPSQAGSAQG